MAEEPESDSTTAQIIDFNQEWWSRVATPEFPYVVSTMYGRPPTVADVEADATIGDFATVPKPPAERWWAFSNMAEMTWFMERAGDSVLYWCLPGHYTENGDDHDSPDRVS